MTLTKEQIEELINDQGNTLFGIPFSAIQKILYEYQTQGVNPERVWKQIRSLEYALLEKDQRIKELEDNVARYRGF